LGSQGPQGDHDPQQLPRVCSKANPAAALGLHRFIVSGPPGLFFWKLPGARLGSFWKLLFCQSKLSLVSCTFLSPLGTANLSESVAAFPHRDTKTPLLFAVSAQLLPSLLQLPQHSPQLVWQQTDEITEMCEKFRTELLMTLSQHEHVNATAMAGEEENAEDSNYGQKTTL